MLGVFIKSYGCKVSYGESFGFARLVREAGFLPLEITSPRHFARLAQGIENPVVFINSCVVTETAELECLAFMRRLRRINPRTRIILTGCLARSRTLTRRHEDELSGVHVVRNYQQAAELFLRLAEELGDDPRNHLPAELAVQANGAGGGVDYHAGLLPFGSERVRRFVKVQDGCRSMCTFCIIPQTRPFLSLPWQGVREEVRRALEEGIGEIVLTGVNIGFYEEPEEGFDFGELLFRVLELAYPRARVRISSIEPESVSQRVVELLEHPALCPHLHLPLQSGSDRVLAAMNRRYRVGDYLELCRHLREVCPEVALSADIMVGFPTEQEEDLLATMEVVRRVGFERIHIFPFSPRPYTKAWTLKGLPQREIKARLHRLEEYHRSLLPGILARRVGQEAELLVEQVEEGLVRGYTEHYLRVEHPITQEKEVAVGERVAVRLAAPDRRGVFGLTEIRPAALPAGAA